MVSERIRKTPSSQDKTEALLPVVLADLRMVERGGAGGGQRAFQAFGFEKIIVNRFTTTYSKMVSP